MLKRLVKTMHRDEKGITGLETAIILIAFVVVASVFAYTVLSAGIFSSQKGQEAVYTGLQHARSTIIMKGDVIAHCNSTAVQTLVICLGNALNGESIDLTAPGNNSGRAAANSTNVVVVSFSSSNIRTDDIAWTARQLGKGDNDQMLDPGETFEMTIDMTGVGENIGAYATINLDIKTPIGSVLEIQRSTPAALADYMILH